MTKTYSTKSLVLATFAMFRRWRANRAAHRVLAQRARVYSALADAQALVNCMEAA